MATELSALKQQHQLNPQSEDRSESMNSSSDLRGLGSIDGRMLVSKEDRDFFKDVMKEMKKTSFFFDSSERSCLIRRARILAGIKILKGEGSRLTKSEWTRMLTACVRFYKDAVLIENYAVLHLAGFSKIIKKHDKITGFQTKEIFLRNVVSRQNFVRHSFFTTLLSESEALFNELRGMERYHWIK